MVCAMNINGCGKQSSLIGFATAELNLPSEQAVNRNINNSLLFCKILYFVMSHMSTHTHTTHNTHTHIQHTYIHTTHIHITHTYTHIHTTHIHTHNTHTYTQHTCA